MNSENKITVTQSIILLDIKRMMYKANKYPVNLDTRNIISFTVSHFT